ncbi:hypothetical protein [Deinococcus sp. NW-56]|uniref:hypothetical protein n=1 Tax=Deinococcus sp. NW-56 TaxID=2080419 RepID=UPI0018F8707A|nr:hypothetical protein [Deinococcus sp. NW-56]
MTPAPPSAAPIPEGHTPDPYTLSNLGIPQALAQMLDALTGELGGPGGAHVAQAREHVRAALAARDRDAQAEHMGAADAALSLAAQVRPKRAPVQAHPRDVLAVTPTPSGVTLTLTAGERVTVPRERFLFLTVREGGGGWLIDHPGTPQVCAYTLSAAQLDTAAPALGFDPQHLAALQRRRNPHPVP